MPPEVAELPSLEALKKDLVGELTKHADQRDNDRAEKLTKMVEDAINTRLKALSAIFPTFSVPGTEPTGDARKDFSFARAAHAIKTRNWSAAGLEAEMFKTTRAMSTTVDGSGGFIVPEQAVAQIIQPLRSNVVCMKLGMRDQPGFPNAPVTIPRLSADITASWVAEGAPGSKSDATLANLKLRPRKLMALTDITNELLASAAPAADQLIIDSGREQFARAIDLAALVGTGNGEQPKGVANQTGVLTSTLAGPTYDQLVDMRAALRNANALRGRPGWAISAVKFSAIEKIKDPNDNTQPLERRMLSAGPIDTLLGFPFEWTTQLPSSGANAAIFGDWTALMLARMGGLEIRVFDGGDTNQTNDTSTVRLIMRCDIGVDQATSFCVASA